MKKRKKKRIKLELEFPFFFFLFFFLLPFICSRLARMPLFGFARVCESAIFLWFLFLSFFLFLIFLFSFFFSSSTPEQLAVSPVALRVWMLTNVSSFDWHPFWSWRIAILCLAANQTLATHRPCCSRRTRLRTWSASSCRLAAVPPRVPGAGAGVGAVSLHYGAPRGCLPPVPHPILAGSLHPARQAQPGLQACHLQGALPLLPCLAASW